VIKAAPSSKKMPRKKASAPAVSRETLPPGTVKAVKAGHRASTAVGKREPAAPVDLGKPFLLQVTPEQEEWLEAQRRALGFRSRAETIRHWLQRAVEGRIG
jgi:hypothetical protein